MSSILTNNGAMVALQTLKTINQNLATTRDQISTGKAVESAKDNAAVWAISKVMESDVQGFKGIQDSLSLAESTISVARKGAETITDLLTQIKGKIVASQEDNVDRAKIQADIDALRDQITSVTSAAQFNGLNLLSNREKTAGSGTVKVLASLDRSSTGVTASDIAVSKQDLGTTSASITAASTAVATASNNISGSYDAAAAALTGAASPATGTTTFYTAATDAVAAGTGFNIQISATAGTAPTNTAGLSDIVYVARDGDTASDVATGLAAAFNKYVESDMGAANVGTIKAVATDNTITFTGATGVGNNFSLNINSYADTDTTIGGGLAALADINVSTAEGADSALTEIESMIQTAVNSASAFGSAQGRISTQAKFISGLSDTLKAGIGALVDANMEEASARLQALQVQQQLGVQALSIANQAPQSILSLFR